jgi:hypothetical protein
VAACTYDLVRDAPCRRSDQVLRANHSPRQDQQQQQQSQQSQSQQQQQQQSFDDIPDRSERSYTASPPTAESSKSANRSSAVFFEPEGSNFRPNRSDIAVGISLYFKYCHRQPIWCFERDEVSDYSSIPEELACSVLALTSRFSDKREQLQLYGDNAKTLIMLRIANGSVELTTLESLCLLSYSAFIGMV